MTHAPGARELEILTLAARSRLDSLHDQLLRESLGDPFDGVRLAELARRHQVHPLLSRSLDRVGYPRDRAWRRDLRDACRRALGRNLMLESELERLSRRLEKRRVATLAGRGPRLAREIYGSPELRESERPEIRVREEDAARAWSVLERDGYRIDVSAGEPPASLGAGVGRVLSLIKDRGALPIVMDLSWGLPGGLHARVDVDGVWRRASHAPPPGPASCFPSPADLLLLLSLQGYATGWSHLRLISDVDACLTRHGAELDWGVLAGRARQWKIADILERALRLCSSVLVAELPGEAACCLDRGYWARDPLAGARAWTAAAEGPWATDGAGPPGWLDRIRGRRGLWHRAGQLLAGLAPRDEGTPSLPGARRPSWLARATAPFRLAARTARELAGNHAESPHLGSRF